MLESDFETPNAFPRIGGVMSALTSLLFGA
jgi:hypothetical protein